MNNNEKAVMPNWIDKQTPVNASNLNSMVQGINQKGTDIEALSEAMALLNNNKFDKVMLEGNTLKFYAKEVEKFSITLPTGSGGSGTPGQDGREIELRKGSTHIEWRYVGESNWTSLVALDELKGENGAQGRDGVTPNITIGTVETLAPGSNATVTKTGTDEAPVFNFGIPQGQPGSGEGGSVDLSEYQKIIDEKLTTTEKEIVAAINEVASDTSQNNTLINNVYSEIDEIKLSDINGNISVFNSKKFDFPIDLNIFKNGNKFSVDIDINNLIKRDSKVTLRDYYISINRGSDSNGDGTYAKPFRTLSKLNGKTDCNICYMEEGVYSRNEINNLYENFDFLILKAMDNHKVTVINGDPSTRYSFLNEDGILSTDRTLITRVVDINKYNEDGFIFEFTKVNTKEELKNHTHSWCYHTDGKLCIYNNGAEVNENIYLEMQTTFGSSKGTLYIEGIDFVLGGGVLVQNENTLLIMKNCSISQTLGTSNGLNITGSNCISINSVCKNCARDGFNYHAKSGKSGFAIEINCKSYNNGLADSNDNNNGSTAHEDYKIIRINGIYFNNKGINLADVNNSKSYNFGCVMFDAKGQGIDFYSDKSCLLNGCVLSSKKPISKPQGVIVDLVDCIIKSNNKMQYKPQNSLTVTLEDSPDGVQPKLITKDKSTIYGISGNKLYKSTDNWNTRSLIKTFDGVVGAIYFNKDELIACIGNTPNEKAGSLYMSYNGITEWKKVLEAGDTNAHFNQAWGGISVDENIIVAGEYGLQAYARRVYVSLDGGETFKQILDLENIPDKHVHGIAYDKWYKRIWVCNGDGVHKSIRYSDDFGETWNIVSTDFQPVGIIPTENSVLFTMDGSPNGVILWKRTSKNDKNIFLSNGYELAPQTTNQTLFCGQTHYIDEDNTIYMPFVSTENNSKCYILTTKDGLNIYKSYESNETFDSWRGIVNIFTLKDGSMLGTSNVKGTNQVYRLAKANKKIEWLEL